MSMPQGQDFTQEHIEGLIWYVKHRALLKRVAIGVFVVFDCVLLGYAIFGIGRDIVRIPERYSLEQELLQAQVPWNAIRAGSLPIDLEFGGVEILRSGQVSDIVARVRNPNPQWYARFNYVVGLGDDVQTYTDGFILPGAERTLVRSMRGSGGTVVFNIENITWRRIHPRDIANFKTWEAERINFETKDAQFTPAVISSGKNALSRVTFSITNRSAYSYAEPAFLVMLYRGTHLVAIGRTVLENFLSGDTRQGELTWFDHIGAISNIEVVPDIDIMDKGVYLAPGN